MAVYEGIDFDFDDPFYSGSPVSSDVPRRFPVAIGGHPYLIDVVEYRRRTIPALRQAADTTVESGEGSLAIQGTWSRSARTWWYGAGQLRYDDSSVASGTSNRGQYYRSQGVNPWVNGEVTLLNATLARYTHALTSPSNKLLTTAIGVYWILGPTLYLLTGATLTVRTTITGTPGTTINDLTSDGTNLYIATNSGIYSGVLGGATVAIFGAATATQAIGYCNGVLIAGRGPAIATVSAAGVFNATPMMTHFSTAFLWSQIGSGGNHIYMLGGAGSFTEFYKSDLNTTLGVPGVPSLAVTLPTSERMLRFLVYVNALIVLGTTLGIRTGAIDTDGTIQYGPLITEPGPVSALAADGDFIWFGWNQLAIPNEAGITITKPATGRLALARSTSPLAPAYASDVAPFDNITADNLSTATVMSIARWNGKVVFAEDHVGASPGGTLWFEGTVPATKGWFNTGWINYGIIEDKVFIDLVVHSSILASGDSIDAYYITELVSNPIYAGTFNTIGAIESTPMLLNGVRGDRIQLLFVIRGSATFKFSTWWMRAIPTPRRVEEIYVPIILETQITPGGGDGFLAEMDTLAEFQYIASLAARSIITSYQEGNQTYTVKVSDYEVKPGAWNWAGSFFDALFFVTLTTVV